MPPVKQKNLPISYKKKRKRTFVSPEQQSKLEHLFKCDNWPKRDEKQKLGNDIGLSEHFVKVWFQNRRVRLRKDQARNIASPKKENKEKLLTPKIATDVHDINSGTVITASTAKQQSNGKPLSMSSHKEKAITSRCMQQGGIGHTVKNRNTVSSRTSSRLRSTSRIRTGTSESTSKLSDIRTHSRGNKAETHQMGLTTKTNLSFTTDYKPILPLDSINNGSGEPDDTCSPIQNLLKLTKNINNQMNWGTFGMTSTHKGSAGLKNIEGKPSTTNMTSEQEKVSSFSFGQIWLIFYLEAISSKTV